MSDPVAPSSDPVEIESSNKTLVIAVLDTSGSMASNATEGVGSTLAQGSETVNYTRIDLVKHSMRCVASMLASQPNTNLALVGFSSAASVLLSQREMNEASLKDANAAIDRLYPAGATNIWDGLRAALAIAADAIENGVKGENIDILLLTDGEPSPEFIPPMGIAATFSSYKSELPGVRLSTFGFGYNIDTNLMMALCESADGVFGFIPDCSMVASVFINFCSYILTRASHEMVLACGAHPKKQMLLSNMVECLKKIPKKYDSALIDNLRSMQEYLKVIDSTGTDTFVTALNDDIEHEDPNKGQLMKAMSSADWFNRWGYNHILAYRRALEKQVCMNFKDSVLQTFKQPAFELIQAIGNKIFADIPAPVPRGFTDASFTQYVAATGFSMSQFNTDDGGCFDGECEVQMEDGSMRKVKDVIRGDVLKGGFKVRWNVRRSMNKEMKMIVFEEDGLIITPWHPVSFDDTPPTSPLPETLAEKFYGKESGGMRWEFPAFLAANEMFGAELVTRFQRFVHDFVLESGHYAFINGVKVVTLGHGFYGENVYHGYYGTQNVISDLEALERGEQPAVPGSLDNVMLM